MNLCQIYAEYCVEAHEWITIHAILVSTRETEGRAEVGELNVIFRSWQELVLSCLVLGFAQGVYVLFGFGAGLIAVGLLAMFLPNIQDVVVLLLLINLPAEIYVVARSWKHISWKGVALICGGIIVGVPAGAFILQRGDPSVVLTVLGAVLLLAGFGFLLLKRREVSWPRWSEPIVGLVSGVLSGLFGTGGPPLIFFYQLGGAEKAVFRANLMAIFLLVTLARVPSYAAAGLITVPRLLSALLVLPAVVLGALAGDRLHLQLSEEGFKRLVSIALVLLGLVLLSRQLM